MVFPTSLEGFSYIFYVKFYFYFSTTIQIWMAGEEYFFLTWNKPYIFCDYAGEDALL